jgi:GNAT superfamily N-acetyltransferase
MFFVGATRRVAPTTDVFNLAVLIAIIWLAESYRHHGYGRQMVALAEQEALQRGCQRVLLESASFQAVPFLKS